jgi:hypothetical protein
MNTRNIYITLQKDSNIGFTGKIEHNNSFTLWNNSNNNWLITGDISLNVLNATSQINNMLLSGEIIDESNFNIIDSNNNNELYIGRIE